MLGRGHICESINREGISSPGDQAVRIDEHRGWETGLSRREPLVLVTVLTGPMFQVEEPPGIEFQDIIMVIEPRR